MKAQDIKIGQRVLIKPNQLTAIVMGTPEYYTPKAKLVWIKYEQSTKYEYMINHQLDLLPQEEQYPAHGGNHVRGTMI